MQTKTGKQLGYSGDTAYRLFALVTCPHCKEERWVQVRNNEPTSSLCRKCCSRGSRCWRWKGGRYIGSDGYVYIQLQPDDFFYPMADKKGYVPEHRLVVAKHLNRCLLPWEVVHHKDGIRDHNQYSNLELLPHGRFHLIDSVVKSRIAKLENRVTLLEAENTMLRSQFAERICSICKGKGGD
ncbi:hypothetical protein ES708_21429 [subsurface metagenome]